MSAQSRNRILHVGNKEIPLDAPGQRERLSSLKGIRPICPHCGVQWCQLNFTPIHERAEYAIARWPCESCFSPYHTPGSTWKLLVWWDSAIPPNLDRALSGFSQDFLTREVLLRCAQILGLSLVDLH